MKNISQFKKALKVGVMLKATHHTTFNGRDEKGKVIYKDSDLGTRKVSIVQTNSFACSTTKSDGEIVDSWCAYPKASECVFKDGELTIMEKDTRNCEGGFQWEGNPEYDNLPMIPVLTYSFVG